MKKYVLMGGYVKSRHDRDIHFISATKLRNLYGVKRDECYYCDETDRSTFPKDVDSFIILRPKYDGNYQLPSVTTEEK